MKRDFSLRTYTELLESLQKQAFSFLAFSEFISSDLKKVISLRHDVDKYPQNSLKFARIQSEAGIKGTYFFRSVPASWDTAIIKEIQKLGHEIGYHYECLTTKKGNKEEAILDFQKNLKDLSSLAHVSSICMHGSPMSKYDSKKLWQFYDYHDYGIIAEPYFDVDFSKILYLTDTGRSWHGDKVSVRDKLNSSANEEKLQLAYSDWKVKPKLNSSMLMSKSAIGFQKKHVYKTTFDIMKALDEGLLPDKIMMTFHPQRWTDRTTPWLKELIWQNTKNIVKYFIIKVSD